MLIAQSRVGIRRSLLPRSHSSLLRVERRFSHTTPSPVNERLIVLGLESSADDSSCAIVSSDRKIHSLVTISQHAQNSQYGGIHPLVAQAAHINNIPLAIERCLKEAKMSMDEVDAVAYTRGPGMRGCLSIGEMAAKGLAAGTGKRLVGVHHMQAHALTPLLTEPIPPRFPFLILLVSGGHTQLVLAESEDKFGIVLDTLDSKIGDVFEKAARVLQLPSHPTKSPGAILESYASLPPLPPFDFRSHPPLPIPLSMNHAAATQAFSFAGILSSLQRLVKTTTSAPIPPTSKSKTSSKSMTSHSSPPSNSTSPFMPMSESTDEDMLIKEDRSTEPVIEGVQSELKHVEEGLDESIQREYSRIFQSAAVGHLTLKLEQAIRRLPAPLKDSLGGLVVSGGVASNLFMREELQEMLVRLGSGSGAISAKGDQGAGAGADAEADLHRGMELFFPPIQLCTDNAAMIAWTAILRLQAGLTTDPYNLPLRPKWSLEDLYNDV